MSNGRDGAPAPPDAWATTIAYASAPHRTAPHRTAPHRRADFAVHTALICRAARAADRHKAAVCGRPAVEQVLLEIGGGGRGSLTHPPSRLRRWCAEQAEG
ncbi:hypothetical protein [Streptomyces sp. NPDC048188]|uniref:hypothetical protein n=1 Tax=Streptomyces sp. NPDC048188 TaxID=3155749 RepID=UPI00341DE1D7